MADIRITNRTHYPVPEGLFGMNMEITRTTFWRGLSAQMLNNRKFYSGEKMPYAWHIVKGEYVRNFENSPCRSGYVSLENGGRLSYTEDTVILKEGRTYTCRIMTGGNGTPATLSVQAGDFIKTVDVPTCESKYDSVSFDFRAGAGAGGRFSITLVSGNSVDVFAVSLMDTRNYYGMRPDVIEKLRELKPASFRFPGGCCADHFEWKEGLKPVDERKPMDGSAKASFLFRNSHTQDGNDIGINEFILLTKAVGCEPEYTVRLVLNDSEEARSIVEYCNGDGSTFWGAERVRQGFKEPFGIKLWYIGNEIYYFGYGLEHNAKEAGRKTDEYMKAMRSADPSIRTVVGVCTETDRHVEWSRTYIENVNEKIDYISYHRYNGTGIDSVASDRLHADAVRKMMSDGTDDGLEIIKNDCCRDIFPNVSVDIDEWNYSWGLKGSNLMTLSNALMMHFMIKKSDCYHVTEARFFHPINEGMIDTDIGKDPVTDSSGVLFELFGKHRGGKVCLVDSDDREIDALATEKNGKYTVSLINRTEKRKEVSVKERDYRFTMMVLKNISGLDNSYELIEGDVSAPGNIPLPSDSIAFLEEV